MPTPQAKRIEAMKNEIEIPDGGAYFLAGLDQYHIKIQGNRVVVRCIDVAARSGASVSIHMPAGNVVQIEARGD